MPRETKKPQQPDNGPETLPELSSQRMAWVKAFLSGMTASDAYRAAYDTSSWSDESIWREAARLKNDPKVLPWLRAASEHNLAQCKVTLESHTAELDRLSSLAETAGAYGASIKAQELRGRANGLYVDQIKTDTGQADVLQALAAIGKVDPALAKQLGERLGLPESDTDGPHNPESKLTH